MTDMFEGKARPMGVTSDDRDAWLRARRAGIGGSDAAAIMGLSPFKSALAVYADKVSTSAPAEDDNDRLEMGNLREGPLLALYAKRSKRQVTRGGELLRSREHPIMLVTLDGTQQADGSLWASPGVVEAKAYDIEGDGGDIALNVQIQLQHELIVTGLEWGTAVWMGAWADKLKWLDVRPHEAFRDLVIEECERFWTDHVLKRVPPPPDRTESSKRALSLLYPNLEEVTYLLDEGPAWADAWETFSGDAKEADAMKAELSARLKATIGDGHFMLIGDGRYFYRYVVKSKDVHCRHCNGLLETLPQYSALKLGGPRKKALPAPAETRVLREAVPDLAAQLRESLEQREDT